MPVTAALIILAMLQSANHKTMCADELDVKSCHSFEEMLQAKDPDIVRFTSAPNQSAVCFDPKEDRFAVASFVEPAKNQFTQDREGETLSAPGMVQYIRYYKGVSEDIHFWRGKWSTYDKVTRDDASFTSEENPKEPQSAAGISRSEIIISYPMQNAAGTTTILNVLIRRSTLRFRVTGLTDAQGQRLNAEITGRCLAFK